MRSFGSGADGPGTSARVSTMHPALLLAVGLALLGGGARPASAQSQDTVRVAGTVLAPDDAAQARRLLRAKLGPTSRHWTRLQDSTKRFAAARAAFQIGRVAYPRAWSDSVLTFLREAGTRHPDPAVRAEFLFGGLQVATAAERGETQDQFYRRLTDGHEDAHYATKARRLFDPENLFGGLSMACGFADLVQPALLGHCVSSAERLLHSPGSAATGLVWAPFMHVARCVSAEYPSAKQVLTVRSRPESRSRTSRFRPSQPRRPPIRSAISKARPS
ncbi:maltotransferase domain-containing protein [Salinibacter sp.]|uniref:maltotransferase domain-containing protein n=1 Tax=Salinibacter sp. TaxID=2065818 RepID=UPI0021E8A381|nr:maltotransferase domain-containing protein [Salinibacter sp.]